MTSKLLRAQPAWQLAMRGYSDGGGIPSRGSAKKAYHMPSVHSESSGISIMRAILRLNALACVLVVLIVARAGAQTDVSLGVWSAIATFHDIASA